MGLFHFRKRSQKGQQEQKASTDLSELDSFLQDSIHFQPSTADFNLESTPILKEIETSLMDDIMNELDASKLAKDEVSSTLLDQKRTLETQPDLALSLDPSPIEKKDSIDSLALSTPIKLKSLSMRPKNKLNQRSILKYYTHTNSSDEEDESEEELEIKKERLVTLEQCKQPSISEKPVIQISCPQPKIESIQLQQKNTIHRMKERHRLEAARSLQNPSRIGFNTNVQNSNHPKQQQHHHHLSSPSMPVIFVPTSHDIIPSSSTHSSISATNSSVTSTSSSPLPPIPPLPLLIHTTPNLVNGNKNPQKSMVQSQSFSVYHQNNNNNLNTGPHSNFRPHNQIQTTKVGQPIPKNKVRNTFSMNDIHQTATSPSIKKSESLKYTGIRSTTPLTNKTRMSNMTGGVAHIVSNPDIEQTQRTSAMNPTVGINYLNPTNDHPIQQQIQQKQYEIQQQQYELQQQHYLLLQQIQQQQIQQQLEIQQQQLHQLRLQQQQLIQYHTVLDSNNRKVVSIQKEDDLMKKGEYQSMTKPLYERQTLSRSTIYSPSIKCHSHRCHHQSKNNKTNTDYSTKVEHHRLNKRQQKSIIIEEDNLSTSSGSSNSDTVIGEDNILDNQENIKIPNKLSKELQTMQLYRSNYSLPDITLFSKEDLNEVKMSWKSIQLFKPKQIK